MCKKLQKTELDYESLISDNICNLKKASMALNQLLDEYQYDYVPSAYEAVRYGKATGKEVSMCTDSEKHSWQYINGYEKIMWLVSVARDYCFATLTDCEKAYASDANEICEAGKIGSKEEQYRALLTELACDCNVRWLRDAVIFMASLNDKKLVEYNGICRIVKLEKGGAVNE